MSGEWKDKNRAYLSAIDAFPDNDYADLVFQIVTPRGAQFTLERRLARRPDLSFDAAELKQFLLDAANLKDSF